jgi:hypothetical protein
MQGNHRCNFITINIENTAEIITEARRENKMYKSPFYHLYYIIFLIIYKVSNLSIVCCFLLRISFS